MDLERYWIIDSWVSSMVAGRSAATVAEISFATQIGLIMHEIEAAAGYSWVQSLTVPVIRLILSRSISMLSNYYVCM